MWTSEEKAIIEQLDAAVRDERSSKYLEEMASRVEDQLSGRPGELIAWEPVPLGAYGLPLPGMICSSWVFILRAQSVTGAERHPSSHQRMMSLRGAGDFQTRTDGPWRSHHLTSDWEAPPEERWISIPPGVWHQAVVAENNWIVVSFHTVDAGELIEERPDMESTRMFKRRKYLNDDGQGKRDVP
jgi:hypothetical protein